MKKREGGQVFILVLILLAIGALLVVPALRLTGTSLKSSQIVTRQAKALYAADAAQEYVLWKLLYQSYGSEFTYNGENKTLTSEEYPLLNVYGIPVDVTVIMRAVEGVGAITLATDEAIMPTKTVSPSTVPDGSYRTYTYTIRLEQLSDNTSQGLNAVYDILPDEFDESDYEIGSSRLSVDGGLFVPIGDPARDVVGGQVRLRWPDPDTYGSENFTSPMRDFAIRQVKEIEFKMTGTLLNNRTYYNWVVLKVGDTITLSGVQAPIITGNGNTPEGGLLESSKTSDPEVITPGVETDIEYTITITNLDGSTHQIQEITDYLPPGFNYLGPTSNITDQNPVSDNVTINGVDRQVLLWTTAEFPNGNAVSIAGGETLALVFWARTTKDVSGSYFNEVTVVPNAPLPQIFEDIGVTYADFNASYSWNTGAVIVPAYDVRAEAMAVTVNTNMSLTLDAVSITSWQVE